MKKYFHTYSEDKNQNINQEQYAFFVLVIVGEKINMISNVVSIDNMFHMVSNSVYSMIEKWNINECYIDNLMPSEHKELMSND